MNELILALVILGVPALELYLLVAVGQEIGALPTVFLTLFTAILGVGLVRWQGFVTILKMRDSLARDELPAMELAEGAALLLAGFFLLVPGFVTDALGFLFLIPVLRRILIGSMLRRARPDSDRGQGGRVIEGEWKSESTPVDRLPK